MQPTQHFSRQTVTQQAGPIALLFRQEHRIDNGVLIYHMYRVTARTKRRSGLAVSIAHIKNRDSFGEYAPLYLIDSSENRAWTLFRTLIEHTTYPCSLGEIMEDKFGPFVGDPTVKYREFPLQIPKNML